MLPYRDEMIKNIANALKIDEGLINVKATTEEGLGFTGSGEGISSQAIASISYAKDFSVNPESSNCSSCSGCSRN
jgi:2-C-methyl-D-erythritol 2,4-cyclodiphosphate synthase